MSLDTVTLNLDASDVVITSYMDPQLGPQYIITIEKAKAAFLAKFLLGGLTPADQARIPVGIKEDIVRGTGLKYVFRLPTITRTLLIGAAAGIAFKTFADGSIPQYLIDKVPYLAKGFETVNLHPYLAAAAITTGAGVSTIVSQELSTFVSDLLEGVVSTAKTAATIALSGMKAVGNYCYCNPKKSAAAGLATLAGISWVQIPSVQKAVGDIGTAISNIAKKLLR